MNNEVINWLLEENNPAIRYRTQTEILSQSSDINQVKDWIYNKLPENWFETKGLWYSYYITAIAECGLTNQDIPNEHLQRALNSIENNFEFGCADFMAARALVKMGFAEHDSIKKLINDFQINALPDGGFLCKRRLKSFKQTPKSCYKANIYALMFLAECRKKKIDIAFGQDLIKYFLNRNIFYKSTDKSTLIMDGREGWRIIDTFHPFEPMRLGIHSVVETFCALGYGNDEVLKEAWEFLDKFKDENDKYLLSSTLTKSYLPKERIASPSKWVTFYATLADKERTQT